MATSRPHADRRWRVAGLSWLLVLVVVAVLGIRALGESARLDESQTAQDRRIEANLSQIQQATQGDCLFDLEIIGLPKLSRQPSPVLINLANAARVSFVVKGCAEAINPQTGKPFGPAPEVVR